MTVPANKRYSAPTAASVAAVARKTVRPSRPATGGGGRGRKKKTTNAWWKQLMLFPLRRWKFTLLVMLFLIGGFIGNLDRASRYAQSLRGLRHFMPKAVAELIFQPEYMDFGVAAHGEELFGTVTRVIDGDTFVFQSVGEKEESYKVRMWGIDAPESSQLFGSNSAKALEEKILNRPVHLIVRNTDRYSRQVCQVFTSDGGDVNLYMVTSGNAWYFRDFADNAALAEGEREAQIFKRGLWTYPDPQPPWKYRKKD